MKKYIGSEFGLSFFLMFNKKKNVIVESEKVKYLASGRDSLHYIITALDLTNKEVLLPSYLCEDALSPFIENNVKFSFFKIKKDMSIDLDDLKNKINENTKAILIIHYFGVLQNINYIKDIAPNIVLIEDNVQSFLTLNEQKSDITFNSYRKYLAIPDGSKLIFNTTIVKAKTKLSFFHFEYVKLRYLFLKLNNFFQSITFFKQFKFTDKFLLKYKKPAKMSWISKTILRKMDLDKMRDKRIENYLYLAKNLKNNKIKPLFINIKEGVCPLGFPIVCDDRTKLKELLIKNKIYPPIHWILPKEIDENEFKLSYQLSNEILTIPCDQRYGLDDMARILRLLNGF